MKLYIDTEFNSIAGELISMALVPEDSVLSYFYEVIALDKSVVIHPWVKENVMPILNKEPISLDSFKSKLQYFLKRFDSLHIISDYPTDLIHFLNSITLGPGVCMELPIIVNFSIELDLPSTAKNSKIPHNALEDALAIRRLMLNKNRDTST